jgi:hypothetical protein
MGTLGQLPHTPDELPGHQVSSGEPPVPGGKADQLPTLGGATSVSISLGPATPAEPSAEEEEPGAE